jgi:hypothetical protein
MGISERKKKLLCEFQDMKCEECHKEGTIAELHVHRLRRGGDYNDHRILKILCHSCHRAYHINEFSNCRSK